MFYENLSENTSIHTTRVTYTNTGCFQRHYVKLTHSDVFLTKSRSYRSVSYGQSKRLRSVVYTSSKQGTNRKVVTGDTSYKTNMRHEVVSKFNISRMDFQSTFLILMWMLLWAGARFHFGMGYEIFLIILVY